MISFDQFVLFKNQESVIPIFSKKISNQAENDQKTFRDSTLHLQSICDMQRVFIFECNYHVQIIPHVHTNLFSLCSVDHDLTIGS